MGLSCFDPSFTPVATGEENYLVIYYYFYFLIMYYFFSVFGSSLSLFFQVRTA